MVDLIIKDGKVIDTYLGINKTTDIAVNNGKIFKVGDCRELDARVEVNASGCCITPGLIDHHCHMNGTEECARYCFIWMVFLGSSVCVGQGAHASVEIMHDLLKGKAKLWHELIVYIIMAVFAVILIVQGFNIVGMTLKQLSPTLHIPMAYIYLAISVSGIGMILNIINNGLILCGKLFGKEEK